MMENKNKNYSNINSKEKESTNTNDIIELRKEMEQLKEENEILKKVIMHFDKK